MYNFVGMNKKTLKNCGFEKIKETEICKYTGFTESNLDSYKTEDIDYLAYLYHDDYIIVQLDRDRGDDVLRYTSGSNDFILKYDGELYMGSWNEGQYSIDEPDDKEWAKTSDAYESFIKEMGELSLTTFYVVSF